MLFSIFWNFWTPLSLSQMQLICIVVCFSGIPAPQMQIHVALSYITPLAGRIRYELYLKCQMKLEWGPKICPPKCLLRAEDANGRTTEKHWQKKCHLGNLPFPSSSRIPRTIDTVGEWVSYLDGSTCVLGEWHLLFCSMFCSISPSLVADRCSRAPIQ